MAILNKCGYYLTADYKVFASSVVDNIHPYLMHFFEDRTFSADGLGLYQTPKIIKIQSSAACP